MKCKKQTIDDLKFAGLVLLCMIVGFGTAIITKNIVVGVIVGIIGVITLVKVDVI